MTKSPAPKPVLDILDTRDLELGPFAIGEAREDAAPWNHWRMRTDEDGIAWLLFDKKDASANTLDDEVLTELDAVLDKLERDRPRGSGDPLGQARRLRRRRRHRAVHAASPMPRRSRRC